MSEESPLLLNHILPSRQITAKVASGGICPTNIQEEVNRMKIGDKTFVSIIVKDAEGGLVALVTDEEVVTHDGYEVILEPAE